MSKKRRKAQSQNQSPTIHKFVAEVEDKRDVKKKSKRRFILAIIGLVLVWLIYELVRVLFF